jgi:transposase
MKGYSVDLRQRVLAAVARGMARQDVAQTFGVSMGTIKRLLRKQRQGIDLAPQSPPGRPATISPNQYAALHAQLDAAPDATLAQHATLWNAAHGTSLSQWTLGRAIGRIGWTRKKRR